MTTRQGNQAKAEETARNWAEKLREIYQGPSPREREAQERSAQAVKLAGESLSELALLMTKEIQERNAQENPGDLQMRMVQRKVVQQATEAGLNTVQTAAWATSQRDKPGPLHPDNPELGQLARDANLRWAGAKAAASAARVMENHIVRTAEEATLILGQMWDTRVATGEPGSETSEQNADRFRTLRDTATDIVRSATTVLEKETERHWREYKGMVKAVQEGKKK